MEKMNQKAMGRYMDELEKCLRRQGAEILRREDGSMDAYYRVPLSVVPTVSAAYGEGGNNIPLVKENEPALFENHGIDSRYTGPHDVSPTLSARAGTGGNNLPLVVERKPSVYCITGNAIDRQPQNGGNGFGYDKHPPA